MRRFKAFSPHENKSPLKPVSNSARSPSIIVLFKWSQQRQRETIEETHRGESWNSFIANTTKQHLSGCYHKQNAIFFIVSCLKMINVSYIMHAMGTREWLLSGYVIRCPDPGSIAGLSAHRPTPHSTGWFFVIEVGKTEYYRPIATCGIRTQSHDTVGLTTFPPGHHSPSHPSVSIVCTSSASYSHYPRENIADHKYCPLRNLARI